MTEKADSGKRKRFIFKRERQACQPITFSGMELKNELLRDAQAIRMPVGAAEAVTDKVVKQVSKWVENKPAVTSDDIQRKVAAEVEKYSADLAYVYQNRGKII